MTVTIGIDVGTQGSKAGVYTLDGALVGQAYSGHQLSYPGPGRVEMDALQILDAAVQAAAGAVREAQEAGVSPSEIAGVAFSGIVCGQVYVDADLEPVRPIIPFLDLRSADLAMRAARELDPIWVTESGTSTVDSYAAPFPLQWVRDNEPETYRRIAAVLSLGPFVAARFAGLGARDAFVDPTNLSGWILGWNAEERGFSERQFDSFGLDLSHATRVVPSTEVIGEVTADFARRTGIPAGTPIVAGAGDVMQSNLASGLLRAGQAADVAGTASILTIGVDGIVPSVSRLPGMLYSLGTIEGQSFYWGYVRAGGLSLRWFRDSVSGLAHDDAAYAELDRRALNVPAGSDGALFMPYLSGGNPDNPDASGTWLGLNAGSDQAAMWRSILESIAYEYADFLGEFATAGLPVSEVLVTGGGARSPIWNQIKADIIGVPWRVADRKDGAILANAALAAVGVGRADSLESQLAGWLAGGTAYAPDPATHREYQAYGRVRRELLDGPMREVFALAGRLRGGEPKT
ncbi:MAG: FGGY family carbohydrate kinase [Leucobacter sp.]